jgi:hypothetical protein
MSTNRMRPESDVLPDNGDRRGASCLRSNGSRITATARQLALTVGYGVINNSKPPAPLKKLDMVETINLQSSF